MKFNDVNKLLKKAGWIEVRQRGSHVIYKKEGEPQSISVPNHGSEDLKKGTLHSILKQAGII